MTDAVELVPEADNGSGGSDEARRNLLFLGPVSRLLMPALLLFLTTTGCNERSAGIPEADPLSPADGGPLQIVVSTEPWITLVEDLAGTAASVQPLKNGSGPDHTRPDAAAITRLQKADLVVVNGAQLEPWLNQITVPRTRLLVTADVVEGDLMSATDAALHKHGPSGSVTADSMLWATWLDPDLARRQIAVIEQQLVQRLPESAEAIRRRSARITTELNSIEADLDDLKSQFPDVSVVTAEPNFGYLFRRLGWPVVDPESVGPSSRNRSDDANPTLLVEVASWADEAVGETSSGSDPVEGEPVQGTVPLTLRLCRSNGVSLTECLRANVQDLRGALLKSRAKQDVTNQR